MIAFPGRNGPQKPARILARHGYGVLLFDRRGEGRMDHAEPALSKWSLGAAMGAARTVAVAVSAHQAPPADLKSLAAKVDEPMLLIAAPNSPNGENLNRGYAQAAGDSATLWEIPESKHVGGLAARPAEYERRVVGFFDRALR